MSSHAIPNKCGCSGAVDLRTNGSRSITSPFGLVRKALKMLPAARRFHVLNDSGWLRP